MESYTTVLPATVQGIRRYLGSGLIKGIGPKIAERIVDHFGVDTLEVIEEDPKRLVEVPGPRPQADQDDRRRLGGAEGHQGGDGLPAGGRRVHLASRCASTRSTATRSITVVKNEPYRLAADVWGIGFKTADTIAQAVGIPHDSPERVKAGCSYTLSQAADDGHCYLPAPNLIADAVKILEVRRRAWSPSAWTSWSRRGGRGPRGGARPATATGARPSTWCPSTAPSCRWPAQLLRAAATPATTGCRRFAERRLGQGAGLAARRGPAPSWPPSRSRPYGWR